MNKCSAWLALALVLGLAPHRAAAAQPRYSDGVIAIVNDEVITGFDVISSTVFSEHRTLAQAAEGDPGEKAELVQKAKKDIEDERKRVANRLIDQILIFAEFQKKGYQLPNDLIEKELDNIIAQQTGGDRARFDELLAAQRMTIDDYRKQLRRRISVRLLVSHEVDRRIIIAPTDIAAYYETHRADFAAAGKVRLQALMLRKDAEGKVNAKKLGELKAKLAETKLDFDALVAAYSEGAFREKAGDLGWLAEGELKPEFAAALKDCSKGAVTGPIELGDAVFVLKVTERQPARALTLDEVTEDIRQRLTRDERARRYDLFIGRLRQQAYIKKFFTE